MAKVTTEKDFDYSQAIEDAIKNNESKAYVDTLNKKRQEKIANDASLSQYAYDATYKAANDYLDYEDKYSKTPSYISNYKDTINSISNSYANRDEFSYNHLEDDRYKAYAEQYTDLGQKAMQNTLGEVSSRTGGLASSYATTASSQANNAYMSELASMIPQLEQDAYGRYTAEGDAMLKELAMYQGMESDDYSQYMNELSQFNQDKSFDYNAGQESIKNDFNERGWLQQIAQQTIDNENWNKQFSYNAGQDSIRNSQNWSSQSHQKQTDERDFNYQKERDVIEDALAEKKFQYDNPDLDIFNDGNSNKLESENFETLDRWYSSNSPEDFIQRVQQALKSGQLTEEQFLKWVN